MARDPTVFLQEIHNPLSSCLFICVALLVIAYSAEIKNLDYDYTDHLPYSNGNTSYWYHCPEGWTLFVDRCFKITETALTWAQAQTLCKSFGGNLVKIIHQHEQNWVSQFVREQLRGISQDEGSNKFSSNVSDVSSIEAWIGFVRLTDKTCHWSDGQAAVEQNGFWAVDGFKAIDQSVSKLCCDITSQSSNNKDLHWHLVSCEELHSSVCELRPCEEHAKHCEDGSKCVNKAWLCDEHWDCQDGSDERDCQKSPPILLVEASNHCGSIFKGHSGTLWSPNFPEEYPPFMNCLWKVEAFPPQVIEILVITLDIEEKYDTLKIYDGTEVSEQQLIVSLGGRLHNQTIKSQSSFVTISFASDYSVQAKGFNLTWKAELETNPCGGNLVAGDQESMLMFSQSEHDTSSWSILKVLSCDWLISSLSSTSLLSLQFKNISLVSGDSITVYDGRGTDAPIITYITSAIGAVTPSANHDDISKAAYTYSLNIPPVITSSSQNLLLRVIFSKGSLSSFVISYKNGCDALISSSSSLILSPGYPKSVHPNNLNCTWIVPSDILGRRLTLLFLPNFFTEPRKDYVQVFTSETVQQETNATKISGSNTNLQPGIPSLHGYVIKFVTDSTVNHGSWAFVISYVLPPLILNSTDIQFGAIVGYSCMESFRLVGPTHAVCGWSGQWLPSDSPACTKILCDTVPVPSDAYLTNITGMTYGSSAQYQCLYGYTLVGHNEATCGKHGWENVPSCKSITCPKEYPPLGGRARAEDVIVGYLREYFCKANLQLVGSKYSHCNISGQWTEKVPVCEAQKCPNLYGLLNGKRMLTGPIDIGKSIRIICNEGYKLIGQDELICMENLQFSHLLPSCLDIDECDSPDVCGIHLCQNFIGGYSCFCNAGYRHGDNSSHFCLDINECDDNNGGCSHVCINMPGEYKCDCPQNMRLYKGQWDQVHSMTLIPNKTCIASCDSFTLAEEIKIMYQQKPLNDGEFVFGTKADIICPSGLYPNGASVVSCVAGVGWFPPVTNCTELFCEAPRNINGGTVSYANLTLGSSVSYLCNQNLILQGPRIRFCIKELNSHHHLVKLSWSGSEPSCISVICPKLQSPAHGTVDFSSTIYNSVAVFRCQCGYLLVGQSVVKCHSDGCWSHSSPTCEAQSCLYPGLPPHVFMLEYTPGFPVESIVRIKCSDKGYWPSYRDSIKCVAYKQIQVSTVKPSLNLAISGQFESLDLVNLTRTCFPTYRTEELVNKWQQMMIHLCEGFNVAVDVQKDTSHTLTDSVINITVHLFLTSDNSSATCYCRQDILQYFMTTPITLMLASLDNKCPEVILQLNAPLKFVSHWFCGPGLRLEEGKQLCGQETLPSCMEDCIAEGIETLDLENTMKATTPAKPSDNIESNLPFWMYTSTVTPSTDKTTKNSMTKIEQTSHEQVLSVSTSLNMHSETADFDKPITKQLSTTVTTVESSLTTGSNPTIPNLEILHSKRTTSNTQTSPHVNSTKSFGSSTELFSSTMTTKPPLTTGSDSSTPSSELLKSKQATTGNVTSPFRYTVENIISTGTTVESVSTTASNSEETEQTIWSNSVTRGHLKPIKLTTLISSTNRSSVINDETVSRSDYSSIKTTSSVTPHQGVTNMDSETSIPLSEASSMSPTGERVLQHTTNSPWSTTANCTEYADHQYTSHRNQHLNSSHETTSGWSESVSHFTENSSSTDCMTTHTIEKQTITLVQGSPVANDDLSSPVYSVEIYDYMWGSFANISCIDAVHISINAKVNELLREFGNDMGKMVCTDASDSSLELTSGNIRFRGTRAKIFTKFSFTYAASSKESVMACGIEFENYAASNLPKKFEKVESEESVSQCKFVNYTGLGFNITYQGWSCRSGYILDEKTFQCFHSSLMGSVPTDFSIITMTLSPPASVLTVPILSMKFVGTFTSSNLKDVIDERCIKEYKIALMKVLPEVEQNLQSRILKNIYTAVENDINVILSDKQVIAEVTVNLLPLQENVDSVSMLKYANFTSLQFHEPSQILSIAVSKTDLFTCPVIVLSAHGLRTDISKILLHCSPGYLLNMANFKCINEILPIYASRIDIALIGVYEELACENIIQSSVQQLVEDVFIEIHPGISAGNICNTSNDVIFLQEQGDFSVGKQRVNISIPVTLVNLKGSKTDTLDCAGQLYKYLRFSLSQPISTMINTMSHVCGASMAFPQNYTITYKRWTCFHQQMYNSFTHQCHFVTTEAPELQTSGHNFSYRHKRHLAKPLLRPQWNSTLPTCIDKEPPTFHLCPDRPIITSLGLLGPVPVNISLPNVTDNSGMLLSITVTPVINLPHRFTKNTSLVLTATDEAGNVATCTINVIVIDEILPGISCPNHLVTVSTETCQENAQIIYNNTGVTAIDNSGFINIVYDPPEGSVVKTEEVILVTASAVDRSFNVVNCSFFARVESCPEWNLPVPIGGNRSCVHPETNDQDLLCVVSCPAEKGFAVLPPDKYIFSGQWQPHNRVPQCVESRFPDYEVRLNFHLPYQGNTTGDCLKEMLNALIELVRPRLLSACWNATQELNLSHIDSVGTFYKDSLTKMTAKLKISIQLAFHNSSVATTARLCGEAIQSQLELNGTLQGSCGQIKLSAPIAHAGKNSCPTGFIHVSGLCYECPPGSYMRKTTCLECPKETNQNISEIVSCMELVFDCPEGQYSTEPKCLECPVGKFQNVSGSSQCRACKSGYSTPNVGSRDEEECLAQCKENHFSFTGLEPCVRCPLGMYQLKSGSKHCDYCEFDKDERSKFPYCKKPCALGKYSLNGTSPCMLCPRNYFTQYIGSISCTECSNNKVTKTAGSVSQDQCEVYDPCLGEPCKHGLQCEPHGRDFICKCLSGFTGPTCQDKVQACENQICQNNRICERQGNGVVCSCLPGFTGITCTQQISLNDHCISNPCIYGSCVTTSEGFRCSCYSGFHGERCDVKIDNCADITCYNEGVCVDIVVGFQCSCVKGFTGKLCDVKIDHCEVNYCLNGGTCSDDTNSFNCLCPDGLTGDLCEVDINECTISPCLNGGLCLDSINSFKCLCLPEYTGSCCESNVDPCEAVPCQHGANCSQTQNTHNDFSCKCMEGYTGERCENNIDFCHLMPCSRQGSFSCENTISSFKCNCLPGWKGLLCDDRIDSCSSYPCHNGATCDNDRGAFICACPPLFTGPICSVSINSCKLSPCQNLGSCVERTFGFLCQCLPGFTGSLCEVNMDECESRPCLNQGLCQDGVNAFTCSCLRGFAGSLCEVNIDECLSQPCQHNSSCRELDGDFVCSCIAGFTGKHCEKDINECSSNPCQHQGRCVDQVASFKCICSQGYSGAMCEETIDECQNCLNNGTCQKVNGKSVCQCTSNYTGLDCGKKKTANFDLHYFGDHTLTSHTSFIHTGNLSELSLCLWVKFSKRDSKGTYLVLLSEEGLTYFLGLSDSQATLPLFTSKVATLYINDGQWHHLCVVLFTSLWIIYKDGHNIQEGDIQKLVFGNSLMLKLGQPVDNKGNNEWFRGQLHGVNMYSFALDKENILNMSRNCDFKMQGNLFDWVTAESLVFGDVQVRLPSQCGQTLCPTTNGTHLCSTFVEVDKTPPEIVNCPGTILVTSKKRLVYVTWTEPEFKDNIAIVSVKQNFRSGQIFSHGQYLVTYIGYDAENNSAICGFQVFVRKFSCLDPSPPINGACICGDWQQGRYCIPSCNQNFHFVTSIPPFYRCGHEGIWNSHNVDHFTFPLCAATYPPALKIYGGVSFEGPACTSTLKVKLQEKLESILSHQNNIVPLCRADQDCNYTPSLKIECGVENNRKRRAVRDEGSVYTVTMNISISSNLSDKLADSDFLPEKVVQLIKQDQTESDFLLASVDLYLSSHCQLGQMLTNDRRPQCFNCPAGYFMTAASICSPCPRGWYNDKPLQTFCIECPDGLTTHSEGSTSATQCLAICNSGTYFSVSISRCEPCPAGEYQNNAGHYSCKPCPVGLTTQNSGAKSVNDCQDLCGAGQELGVDGTCVDCPFGTYSTGKEPDSICRICPYGWTTEKEKSVDQTQCSIKKCDKGFYHSLEDKCCYPCPVGTFQESRGAASCKPCGVSLTTDQEGTDSRSLCRPGKVNECELEIDSCASETQCVDLDDGYTCKYICDNYCSSLKFCNGGGSVQDRECRCAEEMCNDESSRDSMYKSLVTASIIVTVFATLILLAVIIICMYRRNQQMKQDKHVRMYRDETELASFTNEAFDSFSTQTDFNREEYSLQMPSKIAIRWHNHNFRSNMSLSEDEIESGEL